MKTEIYLIRHAETMKDFDKLFIDDIDKQLCNEKIILSVNGEKQAKNLSRLKELNNIDLVVSSSYVRAISTAKYIVENNNCLFYINSKFDERRIGNGIIQRDFWLKQMNDAYFKLDGGENQYEVKERMLEGINNIIKNHSGKRVVIVSHAVAITFLLLNWCILENVNLNNKIRKITFNDKVVINDSFKRPDAFKLTFIDDKFCDVERIDV